MIDWRPDHSDISAVRFIGLLELPVNGFHISVNNYNATNIVNDKVFIQNKAQIIVILLLDN
jgi:hypothetical protein